MQFLAGDSAELEHTTRLSSGNVITVRLHEKESSAADVAAALEANPRIREVVRAFVARGNGGQGKIDPQRDSLVGATAIPAVNQPVHTFNLLALAAIGQHTDSFDAPLWFGWSLQRWCFLLLLIGFIIKVPSVPLHTWLPDAHVEAPTPISMILAGVLLKMGGYGIIRICYPICPAGGYELAYFVCLIGVVSMVYGAFAALAQTDFKRLVAYSSVSHMGYVVLGLGVWSARDYALFNTDYWNMGVQGAMFQMIAHGISSSGMFFLVGVVYDRVHHRNLNEFGGLFGKMPVYTALSIGIFFAGLGLPGLCGFHWRSAGRPLDLPIRRDAGRHRRVRSDPDRRIHPLGRPTRLPGTGVPGSAPGSTHAEQLAREHHRRRIAGVCHPAGCTSLSHAAAVHGEHRSAAGRRPGILDKARERTADSVGGNVGRTDLCAGDHGGKGRKGHKGRRGRKPACSGRAAGALEANHLLRRNAAPGLHTNSVATGN